MRGTVKTYQQEKISRGKIQVYALMEHLTNAAGREGKRSM
ncbi:hypothetical protein B4168_3130 [Anoxybacillus flavithermus]|nr:hypothetical protein B4168_3130 [Anoxybacillus flavithermus]OAO86417.1 hypothetical protein GT23_2310 [Parageobacillus thermoglucosidasius]